jgi:hydrogenase maturation protease
MVVQAVADLMTHDADGDYLAIIGCGNPNRSDDGVGPAVLALLRSRALPDCIKLYDTGTDGMGVMYRAQGASHLVIVDALAPDRTPGAIYDVPGHVLAAPPPSSLSLHDFRWEHALYAGRKMRGADFPEKIKVFLVEAQTLTLGVGLTPPVAQAAQKVCEAIEAIAGSFSRGGWS